MAKWLIIQSAGEHNGSDGWTKNDYLRECFGLQYALIKNDQECDIWGLRHLNYNTIPDFNLYDIILIAEQYEIEWLPDLQKITRPLKIHWVIDLHFQKTSNYTFLSEDCDIILHATKSLIKDYEKILPTKKHIWFPNAVDERYFYNKNLERDLDIIFVGSENKQRKEFIDKLKNEVSLKNYFATGEDMINLVSRAKMSFNKSIGVDVNYRNFEIIGLGSCLISSYNKEKEELGFISGKNCFLYKNYNECVEAIQTYLKNSNWKEVGDNGHELSKKHNYSERIKKLLKEI